MKTFLSLTAALLLCCCTQRSERIVILHTNDTHSHIEAEAGGRGGVLNRVSLIEQIRDSAGVENTLLLDCGDFSQGSLYYHTYKGELEIELMNVMGYDAGTIGNHEFDMGLENLAHIIGKARFPIVCANYDFTGTPCEGLVKPYVTIERGGHKIGVFGLSPDPDGLVSKENYRGVGYENPVEAARRCVAALRADGCDVVVCLSHLGWKIPTECNDERLAAETSGIDIILGGHSHDHFDAPLRYVTADGGEVVMQQTGKYGRFLGKMVVAFE